MENKSVYNANDFQYRVDFAANVISRMGRTTRNFDTCFEMYDGQAVAAALMRRAERFLPAPWLRIFRSTSGKNLPMKMMRQRRTSRGLVSQGMRLSCVPRVNETRTRYSHNFADLKGQPLVNRSHIPGDGKRMLYFRPKYPSTPRYQCFLESLFIAS